MSNYTRRILSASVILLVLALPLAAQPIGIRGGGKAPSWLKAATWLWEQVRLFVAGEETKGRGAWDPNGYQVEGRGACDPNGLYGRGACDPDGVTKGRGGFDPDGLTVVPDPEDDPTTDGRGGFDPNG